MTWQSVSRLYESAQPDNLISVPHNIGVVVCEPVLSEGSASLADWSAGCGLWLHFTVGGHAELGATPLWLSLDRAREELGRKDLRLTRPDAIKLSSILGVTHVALGTLEGTPAHCTLSYRLWQVYPVNASGPKAIGPPITATGTQEQVQAQLPAIARDLALKLGINAPRIPVSVDLSATDLSLIGRLPLSLDISLVKIQPLRDAAALSPLAGLFYMSSNAPRDDTWPEIVRTLVRQAPDNALVWGQIAKVRPSALEPFSDAFLGNIHRYPSCYQLQHANAWFQRARENAQEQLPAAEQAVRDAPRNPDAWLTLGAAISDLSRALRQGRTVDAISPNEWLILNKIYSQWLKSVVYAVHLDSQYGKAWDRVAQAATFASQDELADKAFWKAVPLQKKDPYRYDWGLQLYQPKWFDDEAKLDKVAHLAAADTTGTFEQRAYMVSQINGAGFKDLAQSVWRNMVAQCNAAISRQPADAQAHYNLAYTLEQQEKFEQAAGEYAEVVRLRPQDAAAHNDYGWDLKKLKKYDQAEKELKEAIRLAPDLADAYYGLANVHMDQMHLVRAVPLLQNTVRLCPNFTEAYTQLCWSLSSLERYDEAIEAGRKAVSLTDIDVQPHILMADAYLHKNDYPASILESQAALRIAPDDPCSHENLGEAYIGLGRKAEARVEWNKVLALDKGEIAQDARDMLAKHP